MLRVLCLLLLGLHLPSSAMATIYTCSLQKFSPMGVTVDPEDYTQAFTYDSASKADKEVTFRDVKLLLHSEYGKILMTISSPNTNALTMFPAEVPEMYLQLAEDAIGMCHIREPSAPLRKPVS